MSLNPTTKPLWVSAKFLIDCFWVACKMSILMKHSLLTVGMLKLSWEPRHYLLFIDLLSLRFIYFPGDFLWQSFIICNSLFIPSFKPTPVLALTSWICHWFCVTWPKPRPSMIWDGLMMLGRSCLLMNTYKWKYTVRPV